MPDECGNGVTENVAESRLNPCARFSGNCLAPRKVARVERFEPEADGARGLPWMEDADYATHAARLLGG